MTKRLILASQSPRRKELLNLLQLPYSIIVSQVEEKLNRNLSPEENVQWLAKQKAEAVAKDYPDAVVIGADTIVCWTASASVNLKIKKRRRICCGGFRAETMLY